MAYDSLDNMFQNMGPTYAASMAGQREGQQDLANTLSLLKQQSDTQGQDLTNQKTASTMQSDIDLAKYKALQEQNTSRNSGVAADIAEAGKSDAIKQQQLAAQVQKNKSIEEFVGPHIQTIASSPNPEATKRELLTNGTIDPNSPVGRLIAQVPADKLPEVYTQFKQHNAQLLDSYISEIDKAKITAKATTDAATTHAAATRYSADASESARMAVANAHKNLSQEYVSTLNNKELNAEERRDRLNHLLKAMQTANAAFGTAIDTNKFGIPRNADRNDTNQLNVSDMRDALKN